MRVKFWKFALLFSLALVIAAIAGLSAEKVFGCTSDVKSYDACFVAGFDVAPWIAALEYLPIMLLFSLWIPVMVVVGLYDFVRLLLSQR